MGKELSVGRIRALAAGEFQYGRQGCASMSIHRVASEVVHFFLGVISFLSIGIGVLSYGRF